MDDYYREARDAALFKPKPGLGRPVVRKNDEQPVVSAESERREQLERSEPLHDEWWPGEDESYLTPEMLAALAKNRNPGTEEDDDEEGDDDE